MKVLYVSTISNTINAFMVPHIVMLLDQGHEVHIACNIQKDIKPYLIERGCKIFNIKFQRSPLKKQNYNSYIQLKKIIEQEYYDIVHTHTPVASTIVRLACKNNKNVKVIYTAHGFHFYKGAPLKNWLIYYPIEKWLSRYTDKLITITKEDFNLANKKFYSNVYYIPGAGVDPDRYSSYNKTYIKELRKSLGYDNQQFLLLCIGELNQNKNQSTIIKAIKETLNEFADIKLLLAGKGPLERNLKSMVKAMNLENKVEFLGYRTDLEKYINICDVIITASLREGLPLNVMVNFSETLKF